MKKLYTLIASLIITPVLLFAQSPYQVQHYTHVWNMTEDPKQVLYDDVSTGQAIVTIGDLMPAVGSVLGCSGTTLVATGPVNIFNITKHVSATPGFFSWTYSYLPTGTININPNISYSVTDICERKNGNVALRGYVVCGNITENFSSGLYTYGFLLKTDLNGNVQWFRKYWPGNNANPIPGSDQLFFNSIVTVPGGGYIVCGYRQLNSNSKKLARYMKVNNNGVPAMTKEVSNSVTGDSQYRDITMINNTTFAMVGRCGVTFCVPGAACPCTSDVLLTTCNQNAAAQQHKRIGINIPGQFDVESGRALVYDAATTSLIVVGQHIFQLFPCQNTPDLLMFSIKYTGGTSLGAINWDEVLNIPGQTDITANQVTLSLKQDPGFPNGPSLMFNVIGDKNISSGSVEPFLFVGYTATGAMHTMQDLGALIIPGVTQTGVSLVERPLNSAWPNYENDIIFYGQTIDPSGMLSGNLIERNIVPPAVACPITPVTPSISPYTMPVVALPNSNRTTNNLALSYSAYCIPLNVYKPCTGPLRQANPQEKPTVVEDWNIYPNPTSGMVTIQLPEHADGEYSVEVFDLSGKLLHSETKENTDVVSVDLSAFDSGIYLIRLIGNDSGEVKTFRVVKN